MKVQKITAKLRDAVPVCFMVDGEEAAQYKNIDLPDSIKELEMQDYGFDVAADGKISFHIMLNAGILPQPLPEPRAKLTRAEKAAMKAEQATTEPGADENNKESAENAEPASAELAAMELAFNVTGERRKELVEAVCEYTHMESTYKAAPTFAYEVADYTIDKRGTLSGEYDAELIKALAKQGFIAA